MDKQGQPLKVYHGTQADFGEFKSEIGLMYFSKTPKYASEFAINPIVKNIENNSQKSVMPVYLSIKKPLDLLEFGNNFISPEEFVEELKKRGIKINRSELQSDYWKSR